VNKPTPYSINTAVLALAAGLAASNPQLVSLLYEDVVNNLCIYA
jgi:hypothetical protein